ncbi:MAG: hypothetical protein HY872_12255 [Chloroflexi bacterium]|nr:hypothetical protein [Chloroflexota bacterium]
MEKAGTPDGRHQLGDDVGLVHELARPGGQRGPPINALAARAQDHQPDSRQRGAQNWQDPLLRPGR